MTAPHRSRRSRALSRGFVSAPDVLGAAIVGGFLAYVGGQSFFLDAAIDARATSESMARESSVRASASACRPADPPDAGLEESRARFRLDVHFAIALVNPDIQRLLGAVQGIGATSGGKLFVPLLFDAKMAAAELDVTTALHRSHPANMFGEPGGDFVGRAHRSAPCLQGPLPSDAQLGTALARSFFDQKPFGRLR